MLKLGLKEMIRKGNKGKEAIAAMNKSDGTYFAATRGVDGLIAGYVKAREVVAYEILGLEAIWRLRLRIFLV